MPSNAPPSVPLPSPGLSPAPQVRGSLLRNQKTKNNLPQSCCWWGGNTRRPKNNLVFCFIWWQLRHKRVGEVEHRSSSVLSVCCVERGGTVRSVQEFTVRHQRLPVPLFRLLIIVAPPPAPTPSLTLSSPSPSPPSTPFLWLVSQFSEFFRQLLDYETNLQIRCFGGLTEATASWTSCPTVFVTTLRACVTTPGATFIPS